MAEYIDKAEAIRALTSSADYIADALERLDKIPAADVQPVIHAKWMMHYDESDDPFMDYCSACGAYLPWLSEGWQPNYCPMCGARCDL